MSTTKTRKQAREITAHIAARIDANAEVIETLVNTVPPADIVVICGFLVGALASQKTDFSAAFDLVKSVIAHIHPEHVKDYFARSPEAAEQHAANPDSVIIFVPRIIEGEATDLVTKLTAEDEKRLTSPKILLQ